MKRILPILIASLGLAATTASANFYYDYYKDPEYSTPDRITGEYYSYYETDHYSYGDSDNGKDFKVVRNSNWYTGLSNSSTSNFYRVHVLGDEVNLYLTDFVDNVGSPTNDNALYNRIEEYGYRKLELVDGKYVATGDTVIFKLSGEDAVQPTKIDTLTFVRQEYSEDGSTLLTKSYDVDRYKYDLGTFSTDDVIEIYMKDTKGGVAYSYSNFNETDELGSPLGAEGGFGDGGYLVKLETDEMLNGYYFQDENLQPLGYRGFGENTEAREAASSKAMPLSALDPTEKNRVYFGIIGMTAGLGGNGGGSGNGGSGNGGSGTMGSPLPGGLPVALIAGLFGLGFWYIRRRKAIVG